MVKHALDAKDKEARRTSILIAARHLFAGDPTSLPSVARIAEVAGLAKGTVYLYFGTKEEIFMALLQDEWTGLLGGVSRAFGDSERQPKRIVADFIREYVSHIEQRSDFLKLDSLGYSILERNLGIIQLRTFKLALAVALNQAGVAIEQSLHVSSGQGIRLLMRTYALTRGLWQFIDYPESRREMMDDPALATLRLDFLTELREALIQYWRGAACPDLEA